MKRKILTTLVLFASLTLASCGAKTSDKSSSADQSSVTPASSSVAPASSSEVPVASSEEPAVSSEEPAVSSEEPVASSEEPVESSEVSSEAPAESSEAPIESSEAPVESSSVAPSTSSKHVHTYAEEWTYNDTNHWHAATCEHTSQKSGNAKHEFENIEAPADKAAEQPNAAATCAAAGHQWVKCTVCGAEVYQEIKQLDHTFDDGVASGNCGESGKIVYTCTECGETKEEVTNYIPHIWTVTGTVEASGDGVEYETIKCSTCQKEGLRVACAKATIDGTDKGGAPEGCIKLSSAGQTMTVKINVEGAKTGKFYLRGCMDYWHDGNNENQDKTYSSVKSNSNDVNFSVSVNGEIIDLSATKNTKFGYWLPEAAGETVGSVTYSQEGDCECGATALEDGLNTIVFTRIDSYNLAVKYFLIVFDAE